MKPRIFVAAITCVALCSPIAAAQDLARYRDFQFGMSVESVASQVQPLSGAKTLHERPELIQTLQWSQRGYFDLTAEADSVRSIRFDFYNGKLFKIVVAYDAVQVNGLTTNDLIEAISALYGTASQPDTRVTAFASSVSGDNQKVLARWENAQYSYNLFRSSYGDGFGLVAYSKELDLLAGAAVREADRLDKLEEPRRESERLKKQQAEQLMLQEKARLISKPKFRP